MNAGKFLLFALVVFVFGTLLGLGIVSLLVSTTTGPNPTVWLADGSYPATGIVVYERGFFQPAAMKVTFVREHRSETVYFPWTTIVPAEGVDRNGTGNLMIVKNGRTSFLLQPDFVVNYKSAGESNVAHGLVMAMCYVLAFITVGASTSIKRPRHNQ